MAVRHRKDITKTDLNILDGFCRALTSIGNKDGVSPVWIIPPNLPMTTPLLLPVWSLNGMGWQLAGYREYVEPSIGIDLQAFRRVVKYHWVSEPVLIDTLYRLSVLSVVVGQDRYKPPKFKRLFFGYRQDDPAQKVDGPFGYLLESRRALGGFHG
jgi:hypothetical protein